MFRHVKWEKASLPVDVRGPKTSLLKVACYPGPPALQPLRPPYLIKSDRVHATGPQEEEDGKFLVRDERDKATTFVFCRERH